MDSHQSKAGQELIGEPQRTPEQVAEEIQQTRVRLGDTVAALAEKTDLKAQAKHAVNETKGTVTGKASEIKETVSDKTDEFVSSARAATPESASEAGHRLAQFAQENRLLVAALGAFVFGWLIGRRSAR
jgi:hypothetical protein